jgi:hypothetical protein
MTLSRRIAAAVVPDGVKRAHERFNVARRQRETRAPTRAYLARHGRTVRHGPFAGMVYPPDLEVGDLVGKLVGTYESELRPVVEGWIAARYPHVVNVGSAEGYYAVGFAHAMPGTIVHAYDIDPHMRDLCMRLATTNGIADRVLVSGECTPLALTELPADGVALLADCEGCERALLDPDAAPCLRRWPICVELHEFLDPAIADHICDRFRDTHDIELVEQQVLAADATPPELSGFSERERFVLLDEFRPLRMRWAVLRPRIR